MACQYCESYDKTPDMWVLGEIIITGSQGYTIVGDGYTYHNMPFNYCQCCGRKLPVKQSKEAK